MLQTQNELVALATMRQRQKDDKHMAKQHNRQITQFEPNSFVLMSYPEGAMGHRPPSKLHTQLKGPLRVISNSGADYVLLDLVKNKETSVNVKRLTKFHYDKDRTNPLAIAAKDSEEDEIEAIINHTGDPKRKTSMDFLVRWAGYDESEDLWLPWGEVQSTVQLHAYLRANGMTKLIPK